MLEEIEAHIAFCVDHLVARGVPRDAAEQQARERFGDIEEARRQLCKSARRREDRMQRREWMSMIRQDLTFAFRQARREVGVTSIIVATLGLGIGANLVMLDIVDRLLLSPPSHTPRADRVVRPWFERMTKHFGQSGSYSTNWPGYEDLAAAKSFAAVAAYENPREMSMGRGADASGVQVSGASASLFTVLGARPARGRFFAPDEDRPPQGSPVAVVSDGYYRAHPDIVGQRVVVRDVSFTVVGVAPAGFTGAELRPVDMWIPITALLHLDSGNDYVEDRQSYIMSTVARLRDDVSHAQATAEASVIYRTHVDTTFNLPSPAPRVVLASVIPARGPDPHASATVALWLLGVAGIVLLIACANVATLLLTRAVRRSQEIAVRLSLGISRSRLAGQLVVESMFLATLAAVVAVAVARFARGFIQVVFLRGIAAGDGVAGTRVVTVVALIAFGTAAVTALAPALFAISVDLSNSLKSGGRAVTNTRSRLRSTLAVFQVALSVVLLVGAGLFVRSLNEVRSIPLGMDIDRLVLARVNLPDAPRETVGSQQAVASNSPTARRDAFWREAKRRVTLLPNVADATVAIGIPFRSSIAFLFSVPGRDSLPVLKSGGPYANGVDASYFSTLGTRVLRGRAFTNADGALSQRVAIVNQSLAAVAWPARDPIGACVRIGSDSLPCATVVGVVEDVHRNTVLEGQQMQYYVPIAQWPLRFGAPAMIVRSRSDGVERTALDVRRALQSVASDTPYPLVDPFATFLDPQLASWLLGARMFSVFGSLAFVVSMIGLYGLLAYSVAQRRHEFGIRAALGASVDHIIALVLFRGVKIVALGVAFGLFVAALASRWIASLLFRIGPRDVGVYVTIAVVASAVALCASIVPAWRAAAVDPMQALRAD
jgi:predicted permease